MIIDHQYGYSKHSKINQSILTIFGQFTSHRTSAVFSPTTFKTRPRVPDGTNKPSIPGTCTACRVSRMWWPSSAGKSLLISNKDDIPTDLSRKVYLSKNCTHKKDYQQLKKKNAPLNLRDQLQCHTHSNI